MNSPSLVSCLMVTAPRTGRYPFFLKSIDGYVAQTYAPRELVVVLEGGEPDVERAACAHIESLGRSDIRVVRAQSPQSLGALRNLSMDEARGAFFCQWDDDDLHHPDRIRRQIETLKAAGAGACCLQEVMHFLDRPRELYWSNWVATPAGAHPGTLVRKRDLASRYLESGPDAALGEDSALLADLRKETKVVMLAGEPHLYIYVTHGDNVWPPEHHRMLVERLSLSAGLLRRREAELRERLAGAPFGPGRVTVMGSNGPAFAIDGTGAPWS